MAAALALAAVLAAEWPTDARAGGFTITIIGGRRTGMQTNIGRPDDTTALFHNPAGLADQGGLRLHLSSSLTFLSTEFRLQALDPVRFPEINPAGCGTAGSSPCPWTIGADGYYEREIKPDRTFGVLPYLGGSTDLGFIRRRLRDVVVSLAVLAPDFYGAFLPESAPTAYQMIDGTFLVIATTAGVGWRINKHIAVGGNISYNYMRLGLRQKLSVVDALTPAGLQPDATASLAQGLLGDLMLDYVGRDDGVGWALSLLVDPLPRLSVGFTYTGATPARFEGGLTMRALAQTFSDDPTKLRQFMNGAGYKLPDALTVEMPIPHALMWGVNFRPTSWLEVGLDYRLWLYNLYKEQRITPHYDPAEPGKEPITADSLSRDKRYSVSWELATGVLVRPFRRLPTLELMAGVSYDQSPIPDETFTLDNPSLSQVLSSIGVRWLVGRHWRLCATYMVDVYLERDVKTSQTSPPTNARGRGLAHLPGLELEYIR
jgi:long-subunit fatty acid transport protein